MSERTPSVRCSKMHHRWEAIVNTAAASLSICFGFGPSLKTSTGQVVSVTAHTSESCLCSCSSSARDANAHRPHWFSPKNTFPFLSLANKTLIRFPGAANTPALFWMHQRDPGWREWTPLGARKGVYSIKAPHYKPKHATNHLQGCGPMTPLC